MSNNSVRARSRKFADNMKAPSFNQKDILLDEVKDLDKNIKKLLYSNSDQKTQILGDIKKLNDFVKQARVEEYAQFAKSKNSTNRLQSTVMALFYTILLFLGAFMLALGIIR